MKTEIFEKTVKPGDGIILYSQHYRRKRDTRNFIFLGFETCNDCGDPCKGRITLLNTNTKIEVSGCFRNKDNIRLEIKAPEEFLTDKDFEV